MVDCRIHVGGQVRMGNFQAVIDDADGDPGAKVAVPDGCNIDVVADNAAVLPGVVKMPLVTGIRRAPCIAGIIRGEAFCFKVTHQGPYLCNTRQLAGVLQPAQ